MVRLFVLEDIGGLLRISCVKYSLLQERAGGGFSVFKVSDRLHNSNYE